MADQYLDCKGERCPKPLVLTSKAMKSLTSGQTLEVEATDPAFKSDVHAWVNKLGYHLVEFHEGEIQRAVIRKA